MALARLLFADRDRWSSLKPTVERLVGDRVLAVRSVAVKCLLAVLDTNRDDALAFFDNLAEEADPILGTNYVEEFIRYAMFRDYPAIRPVLLRMLTSPQPATVRTGARQVALAALSVDEAREDGSRVLAMGEEVRVGAAEIYAANISNETVGDECERHLRELFRDESEAVRRAASGCWITLEPDQVASRGSLIGAFAQSPAFSTAPTLRLLEAQRPLPTEVCDLAEHAVAAYGTKAASPQFAEAGYAGELSKLMVRLHEETGGRALRRRILIAIDDMMRAGFYGLDDQLKQQYER